MLLKVSHRKSHFFGNPSLSPIAVLGNSCFSADKLLVVLKLIVFMIFDCYLAPRSQKLSNLIHFTTPS